MRLRILRTTLVAAAMVGCGPIVLADAFAPGNLAVFRADVATANNTTASIVEVNPTDANQSATQVIAIEGVNTPNELRFNGSASSTGYLSHTDDRSLITFTGVNSTNTTANVNTLNPRGVGALDVSGAFTLQTTYSGSSGNQTRSATSLNNSNWFIADQGGIYTNGSTSASPSGNVRAIKAFGGTVYVGQQSGTAIQVSTVSATSGGTITALPGIVASSNFQDFYLTQSGTNGSTYDELYILQSTSKTAGTLLKFSLVSGTWTANGSAATGAGGFGLAAGKEGVGAGLYITSGDGTVAANKLIKFVDTAGFNASLALLDTSGTTLFTAPAGTTLKGVDFAPVPEPTSVALIGLGSLVVFGKRRRR